MTKLKLVFLCLAGFLLVTLATADWLNPVGNYQEVRQYFTDPIFYPNPPQGQYDRSHELYYAYFGRGFFTDPPVNRSLVRVGSYDGPAYDPRISEFRNRSILAMQWEEFYKNWTASMEYVRSNSSMKVFRNGQWQSL